MVVGGEGGSGEYPLSVGYMLGRALRLPFVKPAPRPGRSVSHPCPLCKRRDPCGSMIAGFVIHNTRFVTRHSLKDIKSKKVSVSRCYDYTKLLSNVSDSVHDASNRRVQEKKIAFPSVRSFKHRPPSPPRGKKKESHQLTSSYRSLNIPDVKTASFLAEAMVELGSFEQ